MLRKFLIPMAALSALGLTSIVTAASRNSASSEKDYKATASQRSDKQGRDARQCAPYERTDQVRCVQECPPPEPPAPCYPDDCVTCPRCLGPENFAGNPPICPRTCDGDWIFTLAGFYWNAHQDGMEFALTNQVLNPLVGNVAISQNTSNSDILELNNLVDAKYESPHFKWDFGFKIGLGYCSACDGWDISLLWTRYHGRASENVDSDSEDNNTLLPIWSAFTPAQGSVLYATQATFSWKPKLNLVDLELGRHFWTSKYLSIRPFIGIRFASVDQHVTIGYRGGSFSARTAPPLQQPFNDVVSLENDFRGLGGRAGLNSEWNFGCGWALYGDLAASIVYGRFKVDHEEIIRQAINEHLTFPVLDSHESFRACRGILDLGLGVQYSTMFCDCKYAFTAKLGWEGHLFFDQNQMWRVGRVGALSNAQSAEAIEISEEPTSVTTSDVESSISIAAITPDDLLISTLPNNRGNNVIQQRRGTFDTQGWTLTLGFEF